MDRFDEEADDAVNLTENMEFRAARVKEIAAFGRKCYAEGRAERNEKMEKVVEAAVEYEQAIKDHAGDPCQCGNAPQICLGDCGPSNARKLLSALASLPEREEGR